MTIASQKLLWEEGISSVARFQLPAGSVVSYYIRKNNWLPERHMVEEPSDIPVFDQLTQETALLTRPWPVDTLEEILTRLKVKVLYKPRKSVPATPQWPSPPPRPEFMHFSSLTSYIARTPEFRAVVRLSLKRPTALPNIPIIAPPLSNKYGLTGTAFDCALRFLLQSSHNPEMVVSSGHLARLATQMCPRNQVLHDIARAEETLQTLNAENYTLEHARAATVIASYEVLVRSGQTRYASTGGLVPPDVDTDVLALLRAVPLQKLQATQQLILGPRFYSAYRVGGADGDMLMDGTLLDFKATQHLRVKTEYLYQLTGYLLLERLGGIVEATQPIQSMGIYFARHGLLAKWNLEELFEKEQLSHLIAWADASWFSS